MSVVYCWKSQTADMINFGDELNKLVFPHLLGGVSFTSDSGVTSKVAGVGSVLGWALKDSDVVIGSGFMSETDRPTAKNVRILSVRGPLTYKIFKENGYELEELYGDPALFYRKFAGRGSITKKYPVSFIPHWTEVNKYKNKKRTDPTYKNVHIINPTLHYHEVIRQIRQSEAVLCTSLHGAILADLYQIKNHYIDDTIPFKANAFYYYLCHFKNYRIDTLPFKWKDYYLSQSRPLVSFPDIDSALNSTAEYGNKIDIDSLIDKLKSKIKHEFPQD